MNERYATVQQWDYYNELKKLLNPNPSCVITVSSYPRVQDVRILGGKGGAEAQMRGIRLIHDEPVRHFQEAYGKHPDARHLEVRNLADLVSRLSPFQGKDCDRIEIYVHGSPTTIAFADGSRATASEIRTAFRDANINFAAPGAELMIFSCGVAGQVGNIPEDQDVMVALTDSILSKGGTSYSSPRNIQVTAHKGEAAASRFILYVTGMANLSDGEAVFNAPAPLDGKNRELVHIRKKSP